MEAIFALLIIPVGGLLYSCYYGYKRNVYRSKYWDDTDYALEQEYLEMKKHLQQRIAYNNRRKTGLVADVSVLDQLATDQNALIDISVQYQRQAFARMQARRSQGIPVIPKYE
jgi:hypothetical protein